MEKAQHVYCDDTILSFYEWEESKWHTSEAGNVTLGEGHALNMRNTKWVSKRQIIELNSCIGRRSNLALQIIAAPVNNTGEWVKLAVCRVRIWLIFSLRRVSASVMRV